MFSFRRTASTLLMFLTVAPGCGDDSADAGTGGSGASSPTAGGAGGSGGDGGGGTGGCAEVTLAFNQKSFTSPTTFVFGTSSPIGNPDEDSVTLGFYPDMAGDLATGTIDLAAPPNDNYSSCSTCLRVFEDFLNQRIYYPKSGTISVDPTSADNSVKFTLSDVELVEVTIDSETNESTVVPDGKCVHIASATGDFLLKPEVCTGDFDDDGDGLSDCADPDCYVNDGCVTSIVNACSAALPLIEGTPSQGTNVAGTNVLGLPTCENNPTTGAGRESIYSFIPPTSGNAVFLVESAFDFGLSVRGACSDVSSIIGCADAWGGGHTERIVVPVSANVPVTVVVDAFRDSLQGIFTISGDVVPAPPGDTCATAVPLVGATAGDWTTATNDSSFAAGNACVASGQSAAGPELIYAFTLAPNQTLTATVTPTGFGDPILYVLSDCALPATSCVAGQDGGSFGEAETLTFQSATGGNFFFVIDSYNSSSNLESFTIASSIN